MAKKLTTKQIAGACSAMKIPYEVYAKRPLKWTLALIESMLPKQKEKTTADELNTRKKVEVKLWEPPSTWKDGQ